jgi:hypothetical protein
LKPCKPQKVNKAANEDMLHMHNWDNTLVAQQMFAEEMNEYISDHSQR